MLPQRPHALQQLGPEVGRSLARLSGVEGLGRSMMMGVMPLVMLDALGSKEAVTYAYFAGACVALTATLNVGRFESWMPRRWVVTGALLALTTAAVLFATTRNAALALGIGLVSTEAAIFSVCLSLFIMDYIDRRDLVRNESRRMVHNGVAWMIGPISAVWMLENVHDSVPFISAMVLSIVALTYFWMLRLGPNLALGPPKSKAPSPLRNIPRYFRQRYLRIAYAITVVRGMFWVAFFIYLPIYVVEAGVETFWTGVIFSVVAAMLLLSPAVQWASERFTTRRVIVVSFVVIGLGTTVLAAIGDARAAGLPVWVFAAVGAVALDVLGNIPFMRTVKPRERVPMTTVFSSWREVSSLAAPGIAAVVLLVAPFRTYYLVIAVFSFTTAGWASFLPKRI